MCIKGINNFFAPSENIIANIKCLEDQFLRLSTVKETRLKHCFIPTGNGKMEISRVSLAKPLTGTTGNKIEFSEYQKY